VADTNYTNNIKFTTAKLHSNILTR